MVGSNKSVAWFESIEILLPLLEVEPIREAYRRLSKTLDTGISPHNIQLIKFEQNKARYPLNGGYLFGS